MIEVKIHYDFVVVECFLNSHLNRLSQSPFNEVTLRAIGDGSALNFFSIDNSGDIRVSRNLRLDTADVYTVSSR